MSSPTLWLAERVIRAADRAHPADAVLRQQLKAQRVASPDEAAQVSQAVFDYYRWRGWLGENPPLAGQLAQAARLAERFADEPPSFPEAELAARAVPAWLAAEMEISQTWLRALQTEPKLWLRTPKGQGNALCKRLQGCRAFGTGDLADALEYCGTEDLFCTPEFHGGQFEVQDLSSQAVGLLCAPQPGQTWWDACAGQGGKTLHLSSLMANQGLIWASDRAAWRLQALKRRAARAKVFNYRAAAWDGGSRLPTKTKFDGVLVDAPCSGTGTWQRNPHARWTTTPQDVSELSDLQVRLLAHAAASLKPGGKLVYAVCALTRKETDGVVEAFEAGAGHFEPVPLRNPLLATSEPTTRLWLWPQQFGGNGMFVAAWRRKG